MPVPVFVRMSFAALVLVVPMIDPDKYADPNGSADVPREQFATAQRMFCNWPK